ncbi:general odorant-binding protein 19d-like isoform X2 [Chelonus insularis]|uniref:general odorant-binding protein 19d-like isoform X2 n=1 Tax=Chelonus insularis TaxID=460826 RepID=UPI001589B800|nr:general odorant-binding protein 19d-like isoform X2 [Chelonus insularis]
MKPVIIVTLVTISIGVFASPQGKPPSEQELERERQMQKCSKQTGIDHTKLTNEQVLGENVEQEVKCFHACMFKETKIMNDDGTINKEVVFNFPPNMSPDIKEHLKNLHAPCIELKGDTDCETAFLLFKCLATRQ